MKKTIVAMIAMLLFLLPVNVYADTQDSVWAEAVKNEKAATVTVVTDGSTTSGVLTLGYDAAKFSCAEANVKAAEGVDMYAVNVVDGTVKISYVAEKAVAKGVMFTISFESTSDVTATELATFKLTGEAYTSNGASVTVGNVQFEADVKPEDPKPEDPKPEDPKPEDPKPEESKDGVITEEDVNNAKDHVQSEVKKENGKVMVTLKNELFKEVTIKGESSVVPNNAVFVVENVESGAVYEETVEIIEEKLENVGAYEVVELNLYTAEGAAITELNGVVTVTVPVPESIVVREGYVLVVYRVNDDGTLTNCNAEVKDGIITFTTNHFSTYIIAEQEANSVLETPNTGDESVTVYVVMTVLAAAGFLVALKSKKAK